MSLKCIVKISEVNNLSDARYCAGMGVDMLGFCLDPDSSRYVEPEKFNDIMQWVSGVKSVGEFDNTPIYLIKESLKKFDLELIQINELKEIEEISALGIPFILKLTPESVNIPLEYFRKDSPNYLLFEEPIHTGHQDIPDIILNLSANHNVLLDGWFDKDSISSMLEDTPIKGIQLKGGDEIKPGYKDFDELADILEQLEVVD